METTFTGEPANSSHRGASVMLLFEPVSVFLQTRGRSVAHRGRPRSWRVAASRLRRRRVFRGYAWARTCFRPVGLPDSIPEMPDRTTGSRSGNSATRDRLPPRTALRTALFHTRKRLIITKNQVSH